MVVRDAADGVEAAKVVFIGIVGSVPGYHVEGRMVLAGGEEMAVEFRQECVVGGLVVFDEGGGRGLEVAGIG